MPRVGFLEFFLVLLFCGSILFICCYSVIRFQNSSAHLAGNGEAKENRVIEIFIKGAVYRPGHIRAQKGVCLRKILQKAKPTLEADLAGLFLNKPIMVSKTVYVPRLEYLTVTLKGAVLLPGVYKIPLGTRICDLNKTGVLFTKRCKKFLRSRKRIRNLQEIVVPYENL